MVVRMPAQWRANRPSRATVSATVGGRQPSLVGQDALLDFQVSVAIDGEPLTATEVGGLLADTKALCRQMFRVDLPHLLWVLDNLAEGRVVNRVSVEPAIAADARIALQRMIDIRAVDSLTR